MDHKKQHWVPQCYLTAWSDPATPEGQEPFVWQFPKGGGEGRRKAPRNIFWESDMYTIRLPGGQRDLSLERGLQTLENEFVYVRQRVVHQTSLSDDDKAFLAVFAAAALHRSRKERDHHRAQWSGIRDRMARFGEQMGRTPPEELPPTLPISEPTMSLEDVGQIAEQPLQVGLLAALTSTAEIFAQMTFTLVRTTDEPGFITSDAPCVLFDPDVRKRPFPYNSIGLAFKTVEVSLALDPQTVLFLSWQSIPPFIETTGRGVQELNRRCRFKSQEHFVNSRNITDPYWWDRRLDLAEK